MGEEGREEGREAERGGRGSECRRNMLLNHIAVWPLKGTRNVCAPGL